MTFAITKKDHSNAQSIFIDVVFTIFSYKRLTSFSFVDTIFFDNFYFVDIMSLDNNIYCMSPNIYVLFILKFQLLQKKCRRNNFIEK
jgi:hypothetical protein